MGLTYILENLDKVKNIVIKADEEEEGKIQVGFTVVPPDAEEFGLGDASMFLGFNGIHDDSQIITCIAVALKAGVSVSESGVRYLLDSMGKGE